MQLLKQVILRNGNIQIGRYYYYFWPVMWMLLGA